VTGPDATQLEYLTEDELREVLSQRETKLGELLQEIDRLESVPQHVEARLQRLERYYSDLRPGDAVRLRSPALHAVGRVMKDEEARQIAEDVAHGRKPLAANINQGPGVASAEGHTDAGNLVLGRGYMPMDRVSLHFFDQAAGRRQQYHPTIDEVHYAGHISQEVEMAQPVWMGPRGRKERMPSGSIMHKGGEGFWLDQPPSTGHAPISPKQPEFPPQGFQRGLAGQDTMPVDWLGLKQRNVPVPEDLEPPERERGIWSWLL